ncbi:MAG: hypothetical protein ACLFP4_04310 [Spirochaetales bacterium]
MGSSRTEPIQAESEALIRLGMLLRKHRCPDKRRAVEQVLGLNISSTEKVQRIREIDKRAETDDNSVENKRHYISVDPDEGHARPRLKAKRPPRIAAPVARLGYFPFLFRHRLKIKEFGRSTSTIEGTAFPPNVRLTQEVPGFLLGYVKPTARDVTKLLSQLMGNAWMYLDKRDYNLLVLVLDLCDRIDRMSIDSRQLTSRKVGTRLALVEDRLFSIRYNEESIPRILESIETLISFNRRSIDNLGSLPDMIRRLVSRTSEKPSLIDTILAINMVNKRRYLSEKDLTIGGLGELVDHRVFDCNDATNERIDEFVNRLAVQLEALAEEQRQILKVRALIKKEDNGHIVLEPLERLVQAHSGFTWSSAYDHPSQLAEAVFSGFLAHVRELFSKPVGLEKIGTVRLLAGNPFSADLDRLERATDVIRSSSVDLQMLKRDRLTALRDKRETATRVEAEFLMQLQLCLDIVGQLRDHVASFLEGEVPVSKAFEPLEFRIAISRDGGFPLSATITGGAPDFRGYTLRAALETIVTNGHLACFVFGDKRIRHLLNRETQIESDARHMIESVERIAPAERAAEVVSIFRK